MDINLEFNTETAFRLLISFAIGAAIGLEREYHSKAAGLRTMIMICLGSTIFTLVSLAVGGSSPDRIASNIITGIGFLGAGVIFKDGLTITGITTATTIWISAALGMAVGTGQYFVALAGSVIVLVVLILLQRIQEIIEFLHQARAYKIVYSKVETTATLEKKVKELGLRMKKKRDIKDEKSFTVLYEIYGNEKRLDLFNEYLKTQEQIKGYEY